MKQLAARLGDITSHGTPLLGSACMTVLIENRSAWRMGDIYACPLVNRLQPHVGRSVIMGSVRVLVGSQPAARMGDVIVKPGGPNPIAVGAMTVLIG